MIVFIHGIRQGKVQNIKFIDLQIVKVFHKDSDNINFANASAILTRVFWCTFFYRALINM